MLRTMATPTQQPITPPPPRGKLVAASAAARREPAAPLRRHMFGLPEVREIPRRAAGGPWEAGW
jgi:hypothetical protein